VSKITSVAGPADNPTNRFDRAGTQLTRPEMCIGMKKPRCPSLTELTAFLKKLTTGKWSRRSEPCNKKLHEAELTVLLFESMLLSSARNTNPDKDDDPLSTAATRAKINVKALRTAIAKEEKTREQKKAKPPQAKTKTK